MGKSAGIRGSSFGPRGLTNAYDARLVVTCRGLVDTSWPTWENVPGPDSMVPGPTDGCSARFGDHRIRCHIAEAAAKFRIRQFA